MFRSLPLSVSVIEFKFSFTFYEFSTCVIFIWSEPKRMKTEFKKIFFSFFFSLLSRPYLQSTFSSQLKKYPLGRANILCCTIRKTRADDNSGITKSNECCFIETKSPSLMRLHHQQQQRQIKSSLGDVVMHFSPPSKDSINTDFTNLNAISESGRNSVSRQSLIGEFTLVASYYVWKKNVIEPYVCSFSALSPFFSPSRRKNIK